jgi:hypothetical protein
MHCAMKELPVVDDYGDGFCSRLVEWGGMIVSNETFPKGLDVTPLFKGLPEDRCQSTPIGDKYCAGGCASRRRRASLC